MPKPSLHGGSVFFITGPSGVGKNTLIKHVTDKDGRLTYISSLTTRSMRSGESQGNPYHFVTQLEFSKKIIRDELLEWQIVNGYFYGSSKKAIENACEKGMDVITDIDVIGAHEALLKLPRDICTIFIAPPSRAELIKRIKDRHQETPSDIEIRMKRAEFELTLAGSFDYLICNDDLQNGVDDLLAIVRAHRARTLLREYGSKQGELFYHRTASFKLLPDPPRQNLLDKIDEATELPKIKLGSSETREYALKRLIRMLSFQSSLTLDIEGFSITQTSEALIKHEKPKPYIEYHEQCYIRPKSKGDSHQLIKALELVKKQKQIE